MREVAGWGIGVLARLGEGEGEGKSCSPLIMRLRANLREDVLPRYRSEIRPLLLPQNIGLSDGGVPGYEMDKIKTDGVVVSSGVGIGAELERGVLCEDGNDADA